MGCAPAQRGCGGEPPVAVEPARSATASADRSRPRRAACPARRSRRTGGSRGTASRPATRRRRRRPPPRTASPARRPQRQRQRRPRASRPAARLHVTRQLDDAEVDAVADDDRARGSAVFELSSVMPKGGRLASANANTAPTPAAGTAPGRCATSRKNSRIASSTATTTSTRRDRQVVDSADSLLGGDRDVAGEPDAHARARSGRPAERVHVGAHAFDQRRRLGRAGREAADLDQHQRDAQLAAGEPAARPGPSRRARWRTSSRCPRSRAAAPARCRRAACPSACRTPSAGAPRSARGSSSGPRDRGGGAVLLDERALGGEAGADVADLACSDSRRTRTARSSRKRSPAARRSGLPTSTRTPRYCRPAIRWRSSSMATTLGAERGSSSSMSLRRCRYRLTVRTRRRDGQQQRDRPQQLAVPERPGDESAGQSPWRGCCFQRHVGGGGR